MEALWLNNQWEPGCNETLSPPKIYIDPLKRCFKKGKGLAKYISGTMFQLFIQFCIVSIFAFPSQVDWRRNVTNDDLWFAPRADVLD